MKKLPLSIGILSWNSNKVLEYTLQSYKKNGLLNLSDDITVYFQEISEEDKELAEKFGLNYLGTAENIGIGKAIANLAENSKHDFFLFLENDWELIKNPQKTFSGLDSGIQLLKDGFNVVRYRSRKNPGFPLHSLRHKGNELNYYDDWHQCSSPHLLESVHWLNPAEEFPDKIQKKGEFFITTSRWANWTNNPFLIHKNFYLENLAGFSGETVDFERKIAFWWARQTFKIAQGEGLFTHNDFKKYPPKTLVSKVKNRLKNMMGKKK